MPKTNVPTEIISVTNSHIALTISALHGPEMRTTAYMMLWQHYTATKNFIVRARR